MLIYRMYQKVFLSLKLCYVLQFNWIRTAKFIISKDLKVLEINIHETELSKHVWNLNDHGLDNNVSWEIHKKVSPYHVAKYFHHLCLSRHLTKQKNWNDFQLSLQK